MTWPSEDTSIGYPPSEYSYFPASYVKYLEAAGATIIPILNDYN